MSSNIFPKAAAAVAILGVATGVSAAPTEFQVNATVQNSLTVVNEADMELGTLFATKAASDQYKWVILAPNGTWDTVEGSLATGITLLTLGGQQAARGSVAVGDTTAFKVTLPGANFSDLDANGSTGAAALSGVQTGAAIPVRVANPSVARFYLGNFRAGAVSSGALSSDCTTPHTDTVNECTITPNFGASTVSFGIGATLMTDVSGGATRTAYEEATYTGSFEVQAGY